MNVASSLAGRLARSCHPAPTVAVTVFTTMLFAVAGNGAATCAVGAVAVLAGQLTIGWSNDRIDAPRDRQVSREDKPIAVGELPQRTVDLAIATAIVVTAAFSLALGWRPGLVHLFAVACGWLYNLGVKATWWSFLPYAAAFGALPAIAVLALPGSPPPAVWAVMTGALFGIVANLTNPLPDLADDARTGVRGLPHRLGARLSLVLATALVVAASLLVAFGPPGPPSTTGWTGLGVDVVAAVGGLALAWQRPASRSAFYGIIVVTAVNLVLIVLTGHHLH